MIRAGLQALTQDHTTSGQQAEHLSPPKQPINSLRHTFGARRFALGRKNNSDEVHHYSSTPSKRLKSPGTMHTHTLRITLLIFNPFYISDLNHWIAVDLKNILRPRSPHMEPVNVMIVSI